MRRIIAILLCLLLFGAMALTASAAGAHMSISSSNSSPHRGDTFSLTVSLSNDQPVSNGGIVLSYDSSVFELIGGSCSVSDATLAEVSAANGGGVFMLQSDAVVSGTIFTIEMKVKDDAAFGSYTISGTPSLSIDCGISGTSVAVTCQHNFGKSSKVDDNDHESTCSICGGTNKEAHTWNDGKVTKAPTCKETGTKTVQCTACGAEKTATVPVSDTHTYGAWSGEGDGHYRVCSVCGKEESDSHHWYTGQILEDATCQKPGRKSIICEDCGATAETETDLSDHTYGTPGNATATEHTLACTVCGTTTAEEHTFGEALEHDDLSHFYACQSCGYKKDQEDHVPGPKATEETDQICTVCNRVLKAKGAHEHVFAAEWSSDENNHWHACADCTVRDSEQPHEYDNGCDADCNTCGLERQVAHIPSAAMSSDETGHWYVCETCGEKLEFAAHVPGPEATISSNQTCTVCEFELAPVVPHDHVYDSDGTMHFHKCVCGLEQQADAENCSICAEAHKSFPWWIVCIVEAVVFIIVIIIILVCRKKKNPAAEEDFRDEDEFKFAYEEKAAFEPAEFELGAETEVFEAQKEASAEAEAPKANEEVDPFDDLKARIDKILGEDSSWENQ